jgi:hypothetical protein
MCLLNIFLLLPIVRYAALRRQREYILIGALALVEIANGFAYVYAGVRSIVLDVNDSNFKQVLN